MGERLQYQVAVRVDRSVYRSEATAESARVRAIQHFLRTGRTIAGVSIVARWRNPDNGKAVHRAWKNTNDPGQSLEDFWETLHGAAGALRALAERYL